MKSQDSESLIREERDGHYEEYYEWVPSLFRPASPCPWGPDAGFSPGDGSKGPLHLSSLLSVQSLHVSHIHCKLLHPPSWQEDSRSPQGSVRHRRNGSALGYVCPPLSHSVLTRIQSPSPFSWRHLYYAHLFVEGHLLSVALRAR